MTSKEVSFQMSAPTSAASTSSPSPCDDDSLKSFGTFPSDEFVNVESCAEDNSYMNEANEKSQKNVASDAYEMKNNVQLKLDETDGRRRRKRDNIDNSYAANKNIAEGFMDIALLSANANQLRFLITYNNEASTYYITLTLIALSLTMQVAVGIALICKRRMKECKSKRFTRTNAFSICGVFVITVVNVLIAALTTTDANKK